MTRVGPGEAKQGELLYPVPPDLAPTTSVRGSILSLDQRWLQQGGRFETYTRALGAQKALAHVSTTDWIPFPDAMAHWHALDSLGVSSATASEAGHFVGELIHGSILRTLAQLAGKIGFTPWTALGNSHKFWRRTWRGGAVVVHKRGPASAHLEVINAPVAQSHFFRASLTGTIAAGLEPFCSRVVVVESSDDRTSKLNVAVRVAWQ